MVLKMGMPDHIFLSPFHDTCRVSRGKRKLNMMQGFTYCKCFEKRHA
jgi:hypothetical protein